MDWRNRPLPSGSSAYSFGHSLANMTIKQEEESDSENSILNAVDEGVRYADVTVKKESDLSINYDDRPSSGNRFSGESLPKDFSFIRSCLDVVLHVDSERRHELVQAMKCKLKLIEAITTGKTIKKAKIEKLYPGSSIVAKLNKLQSTSNRWVNNSDGSDREESHSGSQQEPTKFDHEDPKEDLTHETEGLIKTMEDGTMLCSVCERIIANVRRVCAACSSFVSRTRTKCREASRPLPTCRHKNFSAGAACKSCRLRKYVQLGRRTARAHTSEDSQLSEEPSEPTSPRWSSPEPKRVFSDRRRKKSKPRKKGSGKPQQCRICEKYTPWFKGWRCSACFMYHTRVIARYQSGDALPVCDHLNGVYAGVGCKACRLLRLQRESAQREPELFSQLPVSTAKFNTAHLDSASQ